jgi:hypothetical protein
LSIQWTGIKPNPSWTWRWMMIYIYTHTRTYMYIYIYDIRSLRVNGLTLILLTWRKWWPPNNASKQQMGFNSAFKGLKGYLTIYAHSTGKNPEDTQVLYCCNDPRSFRRPALNKYNMKPNADKYTIVIVSFHINQVQSP